MLTVLVSSPPHVCSHRGVSHSIAFGTRLDRAMTARIGASNSPHDPNNPGYSTCWGTPNFACDSSMVIRECALRIYFHSLSQRFQALPRRENRVGAPLRSLNMAIFCARTTFPSNHASKKERTNYPRRRQHYHNSYRMQFDVGPGGYCSRRGGERVRLAYYDGGAFYPDH